MKSKQLFVWFGVFVVLAVGAFVLRSGGGSGGAHEAARGAAVVEASAFDSVAHVAVKQGGDTQELTRKDGVWVVQSMGGYPADFALVKQHLVALAQLEVGQVVRGGAKNLEEFGLDDAQALVITLKDAAGAELASVSLGNSRTGGGGRYVRAGEGEVVLVSDGLTSFPARNTAWVAPQLVHVNSTDLVRVESTVSNTVSKIGVGPGNTFTIEGLPEGKQVDAAKAGQLARALQYLNFDDVAAPDATDEALGLTDAVTWKGETQAGVVYTLAVGAKSDKGGAWVKLTAAAGELPAPERGEMDDAAWEQAQAAHQAKVDAAQTQVAELQAKTAWRFHIPTHNAGNFRVSRGELITDPPKPEPAPDNAGGPGPNLNSAAQQAVRAIAEVVPPAAKEKKPAARVVTEPVEVPPAK